MAYMVTGPDGSEHGPVELAELQAWYREGRLPANAPVRDLATGQATTAGMLVGFSEPPGVPKAGGTAMMPSGNPNALWGYYLGWVSLLCVIGLPFAPFALVKSFRGLKAFREDPAVFGKAHAIIGIVLGTVGLLGNLFLVGLVVVNVVMDAR